MHPPVASSTPRPLARVRASATLVIVAVVASAGCGSLNFLRRGPDGILNVQGAIVGLPLGAACELKLLDTRGRTVASHEIAAAFDRSVVVAPGRATRVFEISCAGQQGTFRSRGYKSHGWTQVDLGIIVLTSQGTDVNFPRR